MVDGAKLLRRACEATAYTLRTSCEAHATCQRNTCERPAKWVIEVRNFSRKQGFTPQSPAETPHDSAPSKEPKNQRTDIPYSATPPSVSDGGSENKNGSSPTKDLYQREFETQIKPVYPKRDGDQRWQQALGSYRAARKDGESLDAILAGIQRYVRCLEYKSWVGTEKVKQVASFLGKEKCWREPRDIPAERADQISGGFVG